MLIFAEFLLIKPVSCCCWKWKANIIIKWKEPLCLQLAKSCVTHGKGSAPQYTLPDSGTQAGSPRWLRTFPHLSNSFHRCAARRKAQRNRRGSGRLVYLRRWRDKEWERVTACLPVLLTHTCLCSASNLIDLIPLNAFGNVLMVECQIRWQ